MARWREANPAKNAASQAKAVARRATPEGRQYRRDWAAGNPKARAMYQRRRARERDAFVEVIDWDAIYKRDQGICQICKRPVRRADMSIDHIQPLIAGGKDEARNVRLVHLLCNKRRGHRGSAQLRLLD
jgi:hypothetical protein